MFDYATAIGADVRHNSIKIAVVRTGADSKALKSHPLIGIHSRDNLVKIFFQALKILDHQLLQMVLIRSAHV